MFFSRVDLLGVLVTPVFNVTVTEKYFVFGSKIFGDHHHQVTALLSLLSVENITSHLSHTSPGLGSLDTSLWPLIGPHSLNTVL